jgi:hypothetical protein
LALKQIGEALDQVAAHTAAQAAVIQLQNFLVRADDQLAVDADRAELVDDHGAPVAVLLAEDMIEQRRLPCAEKPREHRHWYLLFSCHSHILTQHRHDSEKFLASSYSKKLRAMFPTCPCRGVSVLIFGAGIPAYL